MGRQGLTQSCNGSRATQDFSWVSINRKTNSCFWFELSFLPILFRVCCKSEETGSPTVPILFPEGKAPLSQYGNE